MQLKLSAKWILVVDDRLSGLSIEEILEKISEDPTLILGEKIWL